MADENKIITITTCFSRPENRKLVADCLSGYGYHLLEFEEEGGKDADLFILDVPDVGRIGTQVIALKKASDVFLPAMVLLGKCDAIDPLLAEGFDDCLQEPFSAAHLEARVTILLRLRGQSEKMVQKSEARYSAIFEATGTATLLVEDDTTITMANKTCLLVTGYNPEELIGTSCTRYIEPESLEIMLKYHAARRGDSAKAPECYETKLINKAGEVRDAMLDIRAVPGTRQSVVTLIDITNLKRAEEAARRAEHHYRALFEQAPMMYVITSNAGRGPVITECNELFLSTLGYSWTDIAGRSLADLYTVDSRRALLQGGYQRALNGRFVAEERQLVAHDGRIVETLLQALPETDAEGTVVGTLAMFVDITELRLAQDALQSSEARYRALFNNEHTVMLIIDPESGAIVDSNPAASSFYGWSREELTRKKIFDINTLSPEKISERMAHAQSLVHNEFEFQHRLADGSVRDVEVYSGPVLIGAKKFLFSVIRDVSLRKRAEAQNKRLLQAIQQVGEIVVVTDRDGTIQHVNPAFEKTTGYSGDEVTGRNPSILKSGKQDDSFYREMWGAISSGKTWRGRMVNKRKDGTLYTEDATISPVLDESGDIVSYVAVKRDITEALRLHEENYRLEMQLQNAQKMEAVGRLAGGVAHDFNNMLNVILGYGEILLGRLHREDPLREDVVQIVKAGERSAALTRQLLAFSRRQPLQPEVFDVNILLSDVEKMLCRLIGEDIGMKLLLAADELCVLADPGQIEQVIVNLAVNARDAMPNGGILTIETAGVELDELYAQKHTGVEAGEYVIVVVTDTGCGIDKETVSRIFEPFFTTKERGQGTGLGLATAFGIVKQSGGNISVYSEPGQGTMFKIYLPRTHVAPEPKAAGHAETAHHGSGRRILLVEDEDSLRGLFEAILSNLGHSATSAANGGEALLLVEEKGLKFDLLITDVVMPGMNGTVLVERLRKSQPNLRVIFMSGYTEDAIMHRGVLVPGTPFMQKPFSVADLASKIEQVMREAEKNA